MFARYDQEKPALQYIHRHESQYHDGKQTCAIEQTDGRFEVYCHECPFSVSEVAEMYDTDPRTVRYWIEHGNLKAHKFAGVWAIDEAALETFERPKVGRPTKETTMHYTVISRSGYQSDTWNVRETFQDKAEAKAYAASIHQRVEATQDGYNVQIQAHRKPLARLLNIDSLMVEFNDGTRATDSV